MNSQFEVLKKSREIVTRLVSGLSIEQLHSIPQGFKNNIAWNVAHLVVTQQLLHYKLVEKRMALDNFTKSIAEEFELEDLNSLKPDTDYRHMDVWSSMYALILIAYVDREFEVTITGDDLRASNTLRDIYTLIQERK